MKSTKGTKEKAARGETVCLARGEVETGVTVSVFRDGAGRYFTRTAVLRREGDENLTLSSRPCPRIWAEAIYKRLAKQADGADTPWAVLYVAPEVAFPAA